MEKRFQISARLEECYRGANLLLVILQTLQKIPGKKAKGMRVSDASTVSKKER